MNFLKSVLLSLLATAAIHAQAQRMPVPVVDFKDIPVSESTPKKLTLEQVKQAISAAATVDRWDVVQVSEGLMRATFSKENNKHTVVVDIPYTAESYSFIYKDSTNMKAEPRSSAAVPKRVEDAAATQKAHFEKNPETRYAVVRKDLIIHPFYEAWVRHLADAVSRQFKIMQP